jgi:hypothetical protein
MTSHASTLISCAVIIGCTLAACSPRSSQPPPADLLVILPNATDIQRKPNVVTYHLPELYPATNTIRALRETYAAKGCTFMDKDPLNAATGFTYGDWDDYPVQGGGNAKVWLGAWNCGDALLVFSVNAKDTTVATLGLAGSYYTSEQVKEIRRRTQQGR